VSRTASDLKASVNWRRVGVAILTSNFIILPLMEVSMKSGEGHGISARTVDDGLSTFLSSGFDKAGLRGLDRGSRERDIPAASFFHFASEYREEVTERGTEEFSIEPLFSAPPVVVRFFTKRSSVAKRP
jgi:hypothetical protein